MFILLPSTIRPYLVIMKELGDTKLLEPVQFEQAFFGLDHFHLLKQMIIFLPMDWTGNQSQILCIEYKRKGLQFTFRICECSEVHFVYSFCSND